MDWWMVVMKEWMKAKERWFLYSSWRAQLRGAGALLCAIVSFCLRSGKRDRQNMTVLPYGPLSLPLGKEYRQWEFQLSWCELKWIDQRSCGFAIQHPSLCLFFAINYRVIERRAETTQVRVITQITQHLFWQSNNVPCSYGIELGYQYTSGVMRGYSGEDIFFSWSYGS